jgi:riboflavin synthase
VFTGLVADLGVLEELRRSEGGATLRISAGLTGELHDGDSIAVNGVCLTATSVRDHSFQADAMNETLTRSTLGGLQSGARVNLELPLRASDRLGGHLVQGHVDAVGEVAAVADEGIARRLEIAAPADVLRYVVEKGSIAVNGVSLTVVGVGDRSFTASLIPETLERTNLGAVEAGAAVNLEVDVMAKYVERLVRR